MQIRTLAPLVVTVWILISGQGAAQSAGTPDTVPTFINSDVPGGRVDLTQRELTCSTSGVSATVRIDAIHQEDKKWAPNVGLDVSQQRPEHPPKPLDASLEAIELKISGERSGSNLTVVVERRKGTRVIGQQRLKSEVQLGQDVKLGLSWNPDGTVVAAVDGNEVLSLKLNKPITSVSLGISGAKATIHDILLERASCA